MQSLALSGNFRELSQDELYEVNGGWGWVDNTVAAVGAAIGVGAVTVATLWPHWAGKGFLIGGPKGAAAGTVGAIGAGVGAGVSAGIVAWHAVP